MFDHVTIRASDRDAAVAVYTPLLELLGHGRPRVDGAYTQWDVFSIVQADDEHPPTTGVHIAFVAPSLDALDAFWRVGIDAGWTDDGAPGPRPVYGPDYHGAFLRDDDGRSIEAVVHDDTRRGGCIDHLWIGVTDPDRSAAFYRAVARHTGLREGRSWDACRQFRGAWASMVLVGDGREPVRGLHLAFPAPDERTVREFHAAALAHGAPDHGAPGERPEYHAGYYGAFVLDPDGVNVEAVFHGRR